MNPVSGGPVGQALLRGNMKNGRLREVSPGDPVPGRPKRGQQFFHWLAPNSVVLVEPAGHWYYLEFLCSIWGFAGCRFRCRFGVTVLVGHVPSLDVASQLDNFALGQRVAFSEDPPDPLWPHVIDADGAPDRTSTSR